MNTQPVWSVNGIIAAVSAVIALAVAFGLPLTADQKVAIIGAVSVVAPLLAAAIANPKVTPLVAPKDVDGLPLVRESGAQPIKVAERAAAERGRG